jgi:hypothetical protein
LVRAKQRYAAAAFEAYRVAALDLVPAVGVEFYITNWTRRAADAYRIQWCNAPRQPENPFDWEDIFRHHKDPDRLEVVIWGPEQRLSGLGLATTNRQSVILQFVEGDARADCPLQGKRLGIILETAACYAQERGKAELRLQPINEKLASLYVDAYGFTRETKKGERPYFRRPI